MRTFATTWGSTAAVVTRALAAIAGIGIMVAAGPARSEAQRFEITPGSAGNQAVFKSHAAVESFEGKTGQVSGRIECDPAALGDSALVEVSVDLASLDTGINKRNQDMREHQLETAKYPRAVFRGGHLYGAPDSLEPGKTARFEIAGEMDLHGVKRPLRAPVEVTLETAGGRQQLRVSTQFPIKLSDYSISRPQFLVIRLAEVQQVSLQAIGAGTGPTQ